MARTIRTLADVAAAGFHIHAECRSPQCGRVALFSARELERYLRKRGWTTDWPEFCERLRCSSCDRVGPKVSIREGPAPPPDDDPKPPRPRFARMSASADQTAWRQQAEHRRLVRRNGGNHG